MPLFNRAYNLLIGETEALGLKISELHVDFNITKSDKADDNKGKATFTVFNLSDESIAKIVKDQKVIFEAGYTQDDVRTLFLGEVEDVFSVRAGEAVKTTIKCEDGYVPVREGYTGRTFRGGSTLASILTEIVTQDLGLATPVLRNGNLGDSKGINKVYQYSTTKAGQSGEIITNLCKENFLTWSIRDGNVQIYPVDGSTAIEVPKISATSGMIGSPQRSIDNKNKTAGSKEPKVVYKVKTLLNGSYNIGDLVQVDSAFTNGLYRITKASHKGSFEGNDWMTDLVLAEGVSK